MIAKFSSLIFVYIWKTFLIERVGREQDSQSQCLWKKCKNIYSLG